MTDVERWLIIGALEGVWVDYSKSPYQIGTKEHDRLKYRRTIKDDGTPHPPLYQLDRKAAEDFVERSLHPYPGD